jgi:hypothetical protein
VTSDSTQVTQEIALMTITDALRVGLIITIAAAIVVMINFRRWSLTAVHHLR